MPRDLSPAEFLAALAGEAERFRALIEASVSGFDPDPVASRHRRQVAERSYRFFAATYFPHYLTHAPSRLHEWLFEALPALVDRPQGRRLAIAAPRGEAKSTLVTQIFVLWCVVTGRKRYIPLIMDAYEQAATMLEAIKAELEVNPRLGLDYPDWCGVGPVWREGVIVTNGREGARLQAFGSGKRMRGLRHGPHRPDLVILDDVENDENVASPAQRDKLERWLDRSVLSLGPADDAMDAILIGTVLHYDSVLARKLKHPLWEGRTFQAIIEWPRRMELWDRWEELLLSDGEGAADKYYKERAREMEDGAIISWPAARPLKTLMRKRARDGHGAFDSEQQNDPVNLGDAPLAGIQLWDGPPDPGWLWFGACDPSLGTVRGDPSAILVGGYHRESATLYVMEAHITRRGTPEQIAMIIELQRRYRCCAWAFEAVQFQADMRANLIDAGLRAGVPVPARAVTPKGEKAARIETLGYPIGIGRIRARPSHHTLLQQLRHFPMGDHDDGPDALHMLWALAVSGATPIAYTPANPHGSPWRERRPDDDDAPWGTFARNHDDGRRWGPGGY